MLTTLTAPILAALIIVLLIGLGGFHANPSRLTSQCFLLLTVAASCWLASLYFGSTASSQWTLEFCIRQASASGAVVLAIFDLLRLSIREQQWKWRQLLSHSLPWLVIAIVVVAFCQTRFSLKGHASRHSPAWHLSQSTERASISMPSILPPRLLCLYLHPSATSA